MIILESDNRRLGLSAKYSFMQTNYVSNISTFFVLNATDSDFAVNSFLLLGNFGSPDAEVVQIANVDSLTGQIDIVGSTIFAHSESTKVTILPYNQIRYFWTATTTFDTNSPLTVYVNIQPDNWFSTYSDDSHSSGYGWYCFYNSNTQILSQPSNYIPYAGFDISTTEDLLNDFFSLLNNKELRLVTREDALSWASEGFSRIQNKLNLTNVEYNASVIETITIQSDVWEYPLPTDFDHLVSLLQGSVPYQNGVAPGANQANVEFIPLRLAFSYQGSTPRYYIRGQNIGFVPTPSVGGVYSYIYLAKAPRLNLNTDTINLPNNGFYIVKDWMMYRAHMKFQNPLANTYYKTFSDGLNDMIVSSVKRDANLDSFGITRSSNV